MICSYGKKEQVEFTHVSLVAVLYPLESTNEINNESNHGKQKQKLFQPCSIGSDIKIPRKKQKTRDS